MFDFLRNLSKPAAEKRQERLNAYLDGALPAQERRRFETELEQDADLRADLEELRWVKLSVQQMPRVRAPRNFILDPAVYGQRSQQRSQQGATWSFYPGLRVATALTAFFFILALALDLATPQGLLNQPLLGSGAPQVAMEAPELAGGEVATTIVEVPAEEPAPDVAANGEASMETAPLATVVTEEGEVSAAADQAAEEIAEEEALLAEATVEEEAAEDQPAAEDEPAAEQQPPMPGAALPEDTTARSAEATTTPEGTEEISALEAPATERADLFEAAPAAEETVASESELQDESREQGTPAPFSTLVIIEIILGVALAALLIATLAARKGAR